MSERGVRAYVRPAKFICGFLFYNSIWQLIRIHSQRDQQKKNYWQPNKLIQFRHAYRVEWIICLKIPNLNWNIPRKFDLFSSESICSNTNWIPLFPRKCVKRMRPPPAMYDRISNQFRELALKQLLQNWIRLWFESSAAHKFDVEWMKGLLWMVHSNAKEKKNVLPFNCKNLACIYGAETKEVRVRTKKSIYSHRCVHMRACTRLFRVYCYKFCQQIISIQRFHENFYMTDSSH